MKVVVTKSSGIRMPRFLGGAVGRGALVMGIALGLSVIAWLIMGPLTRGPEISSDKKFDVGRADIALAVQRDAAIRVTENLRFRYSQNQFSGAYRDIPLAGNTALTGVSVSEGDFLRFSPGADTTLGSIGIPGTFGTTAIPGGERIVWHYVDAGDDERTFTLRYRAIDTVDAYNDVVYVHWAVWGDQWKFALPQLTAALTVAHPASGDGKPLRVWATPGKLDAAPTTTADGTGAALSVKRVPRGTQVVLSAIYPRSAFAAVKNANLHHFDALAMLTKQADAAAPSTANRFDDWLWEHAVIVTAILLALITALVAGLMFAARELPTDVPEHLPGPPSDANPAVGYGLAHQGLYNNRVVLATLLDLVDRGYYTQTSGPGNPKLKQLDLILAVVPVASRPAASKLTGGEKAVLDFFDELIGDEPGALSLLKDRITKHDPHWAAKWTAMNDRLAAEAKHDVGTDFDLRRWRWILVPVAIVLFGLFGWASLHRAYEAYVPLIGLLLAFGVIATPRGIALTRLDPKSREESAQWQAFERWTRDFPRLSDDPPATLLLWKRILVFGVAFGTAKRVIESGRVPESIMASPEFFSGTPGYLFAGSDFGQSFSQGFGNQVAQQSSSGAGGGGGGGGSSGGGGGGAW